MSSLRLAVALTTALLASACNNGSSSSTPPVGSTLTVLSPRSGGTVNSTDVVIEIPSVTDAIRYEVEVARILTPAAPSVARVVAPNSVLLSSEGEPVTFENPMDGRYEVFFRAFDEADEMLLESARSEFRVLHVQDFFPTIDITVDERDQVQEGYRLVCFVGGIGGQRQMMCVCNLYGEVIWNWEGPEFPGFIMAPTVKPDGSGIRAMRLFARDRQLASIVFEVDWDGQVTNELELSNGRAVHHELDQLPDGRLYALGWEYATFGGVEAEGDTIEVFDAETGEVEWSWNLFDHVTPLERPTPEEANASLSGRGTDWSHFNGIDWDEQNQIFWISARHFDALLGVRFPSREVVEIGPWGFGFEDGLLFSHTHAPEVQADGSILLWDNGNNLDPQLSSAKVIEFDLEQETASVTFEWTDNLYDQAVGDADRLPNGNILVTHGFSRKLVEVTSSGEKVWEMTTESPLMEFYALYRADHVPAELIPESIR